MPRVLRPALAILAMFVIWTVGMLATQLIFYQFATPEQVKSTEGLVTWISVPQLILAFLMVLSAALIYGRYELPSLKGILIVIGLPAAQVIGVTLSGSLGEAELPVIIVRFLAGTAGISAAWWLALRTKNTAAPIV